MPDDLLSEVDAEATRLGTSRSAVLREFADSALRRRRTDRAAAMDRLLRALAEVVRKEAVAEWLEQPNEGFGNLKPLEVVERGEADRLWRIIHFVGAGAAS